MKHHVTLTLTASLHAKVREHLFPGDGCEAAAILICSRTPGQRQRLLAKDALLIPYEACSMRAPNAITWPGQLIEDALDVAEQDDLSLILVHSHPGGMLEFSEIDDASDAVVMPCLFAAHGDIHGSAVMVQDGRMQGRLYNASMQVTAITLISIIGDRLRFYFNSSPAVARPMACSTAMTNELGELSACIIGVSGTGSIVAEQAARLGFGRVTLIDFDHVEHKNLNRILNSTIQDADEGSAKVDVMARAIHACRGDGIANPIRNSIASREAVLAASDCDVLFSCTDTRESRCIADMLCEAFLLPLFDVGVSIEARDSGSGPEIVEMCGRIDYVKPDGASLQDRGVYTPASLREEYLKQHAPQAYADEVRAGYIKGTSDTSPAVIALNMRAAASCIQEFIARTYPYRQQPDSNFASTRFYLTEEDAMHESEEKLSKAPKQLLARGKKEPLLGLPALTKRAS